MYLNLCDYELRRHTAAHGPSLTIGACFPQNLVRRLIMTESPKAMLRKAVRNVCRVLAPVNLALHEKLAAFHNKSIPVVMVCADRENRICCPGGCLQNLDARVCSGHVPDILGDYSVIGPPCYILPRCYP